MSTKLQQQQNKKNPSERRKKNAINFNAKTLYPDLDISLSIERHRGLVNLYRSL